VLERGHGVTVLMFCLRHDRERAREGGKMLKGDFVA